MSAGFWDKEQNAGVIRFPRLSESGALDYITFMLTRFMLKVEKASKAVISMN